MSVNPSQGEHRQVQARLEGWFVGEPVPRTEALSVRAHLRGCAECARYFDELAAAEQALLGGARLEEDGGDELAPFTRRYTDAVVSALAHGQAEPSAPRGVWAWLRELRPLSWAAAGAVAAALLVTAALAITGREASAPAPADEGLVARAGGEVGEVRGVRFIELFCAREIPGTGRVEFVDADPATGTLRCGADDELKVAFINHAEAGSAPLPWLALVGVDARSGRARSYRPAAAWKVGGASMEIGESDRLRPLGETMRVGALNARGPVRIYAVFSAAPLDQAALEARVQAQVTGGAAPATLELDGLEAGGGARLGSGPSGLYRVTSRALEISAPIEVGP